MDVIVRRVRLDDDKPCVNIGVRGGQITLFAATGARTGAIVMNRRARRVICSKSML